MFLSLDRMVRSWIANLADAVLVAIDTVKPPRQFVLQKSAGQWELKQGSGTAAAIARLAEINDDVSIDPPSARALLRNSLVRIEVPAHWVFRRTLDPISIKTLPYLDGFVRHHIERVTPWRVSDTYFSVATLPIPTDHDKISVNILVVARQLLTHPVKYVTAARPRRIVIDAAGENLSPLTRIDVALATGETRRRQVTDRIIGAAMIAALLGVMVSVVATSWYQSVLDDRIADLDRSISAKRDFLANAATRRVSSVASTSRPQALKASEPAAVVLIEKLSAILPDYAYLTDLHLWSHRVQITGVSKDVAGLIPMIERSGSFTDVSFFAPTTRLANTSGDRFYIEMRIKPGEGYSQRQAVIH